MAKQTNCLQNIRNEIERIIGEAIKAGGLRFDMTETEIQDWVEK